MNIKAFYVCSKKNPKAECIHVREKLPAIKADCEKIHLKIKGLNSKPGERNKLKTAYGAWFVMHGNGWVYAVCTSETYPQRHAYGLINTIKGQTEKNDPDNPKFIKELKKIVEKDTQKYNTVEKIDKVHQAQAEVNNLQQELHLGIGKVIGGKETLEDLDDKAIQMRSLSKEFEQKAIKLESITFWQKWKMIMLIGLGVSGFVTVTVASILIKNG